MTMIISDNSLKEMSRPDFLTHIQQYGGATQATIMACRADPEFEYFWFVFDVSLVVAHDREIAQALPSMAAKDYLIDVESVIDNWPRHNQP